MVGWWGRSLILTRLNPPPPLHKATVAMAALTTTDLHGALPLIAKGKVRDIYELPDNSSLLFVATDRISAYDVVMSNVPSLSSARNL